MRYAWAREEWGRLAAENSAWKEQGTFTVRFREVLDTTAVEAIHKRVIAEARLGRDVHETLARGALAERVVVSIDPKSLASDDPEEVFERITASGMTIVSSGYGSLLLRWLDVLPLPAARAAAAWPRSQIGIFTLRPGAKTASAFSFCTKTAARAGPVSLSWAVSIAPTMRC